MWWAEHALDMTTSTQHEAVIAAKKEYFPVDPLPGHEIVFPPCDKIGADTYLVIVDWHAE